MRAPVSSGKEAVATWAMTFSIANHPETMGLSGFRRRDSNPNKRIQSPLSCHWTTPERESHLYKTAAKTQGRGCRRGCPWNLDARSVSVGGVARKRPFFPFLAADPADDGFAPLVPPLAPWADLSP